MVTRARVWLEAVMPEWLTDGMALFVIVLGMIALIAR